MEFFIGQEVFGLTSGIVAAIYLDSQELELFNLRTCALVRVAMTEVEA